MSEKGLEYAQMIEVPADTCTVTHKKLRRKKRRTEDLKARVIESVNKKVSNTNNSSFLQEAAAKPKFNIVLFEFVMIFVLCAVIFLTSIFVPSSGINVFLRKAIGGNVEPQQMQQKEYSEYLPASPVHDYSALSMEDGVMTFSGSASVYSPLDGVVQSVTKLEDDNYILEISHTDDFKTVISGASFAYYKVGDSIYKSIPVAYVKDGTVNFYLYNQNSLLNNYTLIDGNIVWQV